MGEPGWQFLSPWTYDCSQDRDVYPLQQLGVECRSIDRVAHRYHQPEPDVHNLHQHDWKEIDIDDDRLLSMARASVTARQRPRSAHRSDVRHEYHSTREFASDRNYQQPVDRRQRIRPRSALSHRPDIQEDQQQRQYTRPQSAKPGRDHDISIDPNEFVQSLPQYLKDSKWTAMMQRGQSFRQSNLRRLEQETMELLQSVFRLEQPATSQNYSSTHAAHTSVQAVAVACGSGLQLARTKKSQQQQNQATSEDEDSASPSKTNLKERQRVREKTKRRTKRKTDPGYMKQTECHAHRLEERLGTTKKPSPVKKSGAKKQSRPSIEVNSAVAESSRERVLQEMGWLFGDTVALGNGNTKPLKTRSQYDQVKQRNAAPSFERATITEDDNHLLAEDKQHTEPSPQTKQHQAAVSLNGKANSIGMISADSVLDNIPGCIHDGYASHCQSNEVETGAVSSIQSPAFDGQVSEFKEDILVDSVEHKEETDRFERRHDTASATLRDTDTESEPSPTMYRNGGFGNVSNGESEHLETQPQHLMLQYSECLISTAPESDTDVTDPEFGVKDGSPQVRPSDSAVHEPYGAGTVPSSFTPQQCEKDPVLCSEPQYESAEDHSRMQLDAQTPNPEVTHIDIAHSSRPELRDAISPNGGHANGEDIGKVDHGSATSPVQDSEFRQRQSPHQQAVSVQAGRSSSLQAGDDTEKSLLVEGFISDSSEHDTPKTGEGWSSSEDGSVSELMKLCDMLVTTPYSNGVEDQTDPTIPVDRQDESSYPAVGSPVESAAPRTFSEEDSSMEELRPQIHCELPGALELPSVLTSTVYGDDQSFLVGAHITGGNVLLRMEDLSSSDSSYLHSCHAMDQLQGKNGSVLFAEAFNSHSHDDNTEGQLISRDVNCKTSPSITTTHELECEAPDEGGMRLANSSFGTQNDEDDAHAAHSESIVHGSGICEVGSLRTLQAATVSSPLTNSAASDPPVDTQREYSIPANATVMGNDTIEHKLDAEADNDTIDTMEPLQISSPMPDTPMMSEDSNDLLVDADEMSCEPNTHRQGEEDESVCEGRAHVLPKVPTLDLNEVAKGEESESVLASSRSPVVLSSPIIEQTPSNDVDGPPRVLSVDSAAEALPSGTVHHEIASDIAFIQPASDISSESSTDVGALYNSSHVLGNGADPADLPLSVASNLMESSRSLDANSADHFKPQGEIGSEQDYRMRLAAQRIQKQYRCFVDRRLLIEQSKFLATKSQRQSRKRSRLEAKRLSLAPVRQEPDASLSCFPAIQKPITPLEETLDAGPSSLSTMINDPESYVEPGELIKLDYSLDDGDTPMEVADPDAMLFEKAKPVDHLDDLEPQPAEKDYFSEAFHTDSQTEVEMADIVPVRVSRLSLSLAAMAFDDADGSAFFDTTSDPVVYPMDFEEEVSAFVDPLPTDAKWERYIDTATLKSFYYHSELQISQWTPPNEPFVDKASLNQQQAEAISTKEIELPFNDAGRTAESDNSWSLRRNRSVSAAKSGDWQAFVDESTQQTFYYNAKTQESSWEMPVGFQYEGSQEPAAAPVESPWVMFMDEASGAPYYVNMETSETTWDNPFEHQLRSGEEDDYLIALDENSAEFYELG